MTRTTALVRVIEEGVQYWLDAAEDIEALLPRLRDYDRHLWASRAKAYRERAHAYEQLLSSRDEPRTIGAQPS